MSKPVFDDLFSVSGRRNRISFLLYTLAVLAMLLVIWVIAFYLPSQGITVFAILVTLALMVSHVIVSGQRCRDFGWTGWAVLIVLVPFVGQFFQIALFLIPGSVGPNRYGSDPLAPGA